jgi:hypothetical protein
VTAAFVPDAPTKAQTTGPPPQRGFTPDKPVQAKAFVPDTHATPTPTSGLNWGKYTPPQTPNFSSAGQKLLPLLDKVADQRGVPRSVMRTVYAIESGWTPDPQHSGDPAGAYGPGQIEAANVASQGKGFDRTNPEQAFNYMAGSLSSAYKKYNDWGLAAGAYNTGGGAIDQWLHGGGNLDDVTDVTNKITGSKSNDVRSYMLRVRGAYEGEQFDSYHKAQQNAQLDAVHRRVAASVAAAKATLGRMTTMDGNGHYQLKQASPLIDVQGPLAAIGSYLETITLASPFLGALVGRKPVPESYDANLSRQSAGVEAFGKHLAENPWVQRLGPPAEIAARLVQLAGYITPQRTGLFAQARSLGDIAAAEGDVGHAFMQGPSHLAQAEQRYSIGSPGFIKATTGSEHHPRFDAALRTAFDLISPGTGLVGDGLKLLRNVASKSPELERVMVDLAQHGDVIRNSPAVRGLVSMFTPSAVLRYAAKDLGLNAEEAVRLGRGWVSSQARAGYSASLARRDIFSDTTREQRVEIERRSEQLGGDPKAGAPNKNVPEPMKGPSLDERAARHRGTMLAMDDDSLAHALIDENRMFDTSRYTYRGGPRGSVYRFDGASDVMDYYGTGARGGRGAGKGADTAAVGKHKAYETYDEAQASGNLSSRYDPADNIQRFLTNRGTRVGLESTLHDLYGAGYGRELTYTDPKSGAPLTGSLGISTTGKGAAGMAAAQNLGKRADEGAALVAGAKAAGIPLSDIRSIRRANPAAVQRLINEAQKASKVAGEVARLFRYQDRPGEPEESLRGGAFFHKSKPSEHIQRLYGKHEVVRTPSAANPLRIQGWSTPSFQAIKQLVPGEKGARIAEGFDKGTMPLSEAVGLLRSVGVPEAQVAKLSKGIGGAGDIHQAIADRYAAELAKSKGYDAIENDLEFFSLKPSATKPSKLSEDAAAAAANFKAARDAALKNAENAEQRATGRVSEASGARKSVAGADLGRSVAKAIYGPNSKLERRISALGDQLDRAVVNKAKSDKLQAAINEHLEAHQYKTFDRIQKNAEAAERTSGFVPAGDLARDLKVSLPSLKPYFSYHSGVAKFLRDMGATGEEAGAWSQLMDGFNKLYRVGIIYNPVRHLFINMPTNYLASGGKPINILRAFVDDGYVSPEWTAKLEERDGIKRMGDTSVFGGSAGTSFDTPFKRVFKEAYAKAADLAQGDKATQVLAALGETGNAALSRAWQGNQRLVFDWGETRLATARFREMVEDEGLTMDEAANKVSGIFGSALDLSKTGIDNMLHRALLFYPWLKATIPLMMRAMYRAPSYVWTPYARSQDWNRATQDPRWRAQTEGTYHLGNWNGKDAYMSWPGPQKYLEDVLSVFDPAGGDTTAGLTPRMTKMLNLATSELKPMPTGILAAAGATAVGKPAEPGPPNFQTLWDNAAPPRVQLSQATTSLLQRLPFGQVIAGTVSNVDSVFKGDPSAYLSALSLVPYSRPSPQVEKAQRKMFYQYTDTSGKIESAIRNIRQQPGLPEFKELRTAALRDAQMISYVQMKAHAQLMDPSVTAKDRKAITAQTQTLIKQIQMEMQALNTGAQRIQMLQSNPSGAQSIPGFKPDNPAPTSPPGFSASPPP